MEPIDKCGAEYNIDCDNCPESYIGAKGHTLKTRVQEHKTSGIFKVSPKTTSASQVTLEIRSYTEKCTSSPRRPSRPSRVLHLCNRSTLKNQRDSGTTGGRTKTEKSCSSIRIRLNHPHQNGTKIMTPQKFMIK